MGDNFYPKVDTTFLIEQIIKSGKIIPESQIRIGSTYTFVINGPQELHKRLILMREIDNQINFEQASALAIRFSFMGVLLNWLLINRNWKEGGYIV
jgi:hypothetical protein